MELCNGLQIRAGFSFQREFKMCFHCQNLPNTNLTRRKEPLYKNQTEKLGMRDSHYITCYLCEIIGQDTSILQNIWKSLSQNSVNSFSLSTSFNKCISKEQILRENVELQRKIIIHMELLKKKGKILRTCFQKRLNYYAVSFRQALYLRDISRMLNL